VLEEPLAARAQSDRTGGSSDSKPSVNFSDKFSKDELRELTAAVLHLENLSPLQQQAVDYMRARLAEVPEELQPCEQVKADVRLLRFLRSQRWNCAAAWGAYEDFLRFRKAQNLDMLAVEMVKANPEFFEGGGELLREIHFHTLSAQSEGPYPRLFTRRVDGGYQLLYDRHGNLLVVEAPGTADFAGPSSNRALAPRLSSSLRSSALRASHARTCPAAAGLVALGVDGWLEALTWHNELRVLLLDELSRRQASRPVVPARSRAASPPSLCRTGRAPSCARARCSTWAGSR
jgi:hypothetical protein